MKFICKECNGDPCVLDAGNNCTLSPDAFECPKKIRNNDCKWERLPKLTAEVFEHPDCPNWAQFAAVDKNGKAYWYGQKPEKLVCEFIIIGWGHERMKEIPGSFDETDWQNTIIKRPEKKPLPEWVKTGAWAYNNGRYGKITGINHSDGKIDIGETGHFIPIIECSEARLRPWTAREAIGKTVCWKGDYSFQENMAIINAVDCDGDLMGDLIGNTNLEDLTKKCFYQLDGNPCGVLEHKNEKGEWVK